MRKNFFTLIAMVTILCAGSVLLGARPKAAPASSGYTLAKTISIPGDEGWDYVGVDSAARRVYVSHGSHVVVLDADTYAIAGDIADTAGVHGVAIAEDLGRGFTSNGRTNNSTFFDLKTLKPIGVYPTGTNPDAIAYEPVTKRVFTFNGRSQDATALDAMTGASLGTIALGGKPEFAAIDGAGGIYVNIEDKSELVHLDAKKLTILHRWPLAPCQEPSGLAIDLKNHRLFAGCDNKMMAVIDGETGKVVATPAIGDGVDANAFDPATNLAFASTGDGHLTVVHEDSADKYTVIENVATKKSARTMGLDLKTHAIFLPSAEFDAPAAGERRGKMKPGSFAVLVMTKK
ncbi:MAG TPA: YncE family protein [Candidatus Acidoferrum sp.]|jgi:DNA-binding beta-propeller fold protein YncE|nr:YncE family protein [Candidatus Acidoferrum sp.]